jgi:branched-chain amino acid aminotransferase
MYDTSQALDTLCTVAQRNQRQQQETPGFARNAMEPARGTAVNTLLYAVEGNAVIELPVAESMTTAATGLYRGLELGVYSALRTFEHCKFLHLDHHFARTRQSMQRLGWRYPWNESCLRRSLDTVCAAAPFGEMRVRFDILAAPAMSLGTRSRELIALTAFTPPAPELYERGVNVATTAAIRREDPLVKTANFVTDRSGIEASAPQAHEHLIVDARGAILEGLSSNFYAVREGVLYTAGDKILEGVTRRIVLQCAHELSIPVVLDAPAANTVAQFDEAAISSSSRGLLPVVHINGQAVATGVPGPVVCALRTAYENYVARHISRAA